MNLITWIVFGFIAGTIASVFEPELSTEGFLGSVILGILGAILGGFLANLVFGISIGSFSISSFVVAVLGSLLLLYISRGVRKV